MRILATCSLGGAGHWLPLAEFLTAATRPGDEVLVVAPPALRDMVERAGFEHMEGGEPPESEIGPLRERLPIEPPEVASVLGNRELFGRLAARAMRPHVTTAAEHWRPDLVLRDPCEYAGAIVAAERDVPCAQVGISLAEVEWGSLGVASAALEYHRHGITADIASSAYVTRFPERLDPSPFPSTLRYRPTTASVIDPLPDWWTTIPGDRPAPLVYVTFGTVFPYLTFAADTYRQVLGALADVPIRVLLTVGRTFPIDRLGAVPGNAHVEPWVDQRRVLAHAAAVVCHGGSGTVLGALAAGVPLVVLPSFSDQHTNAGLVERHGLGVVVERGRHDVDVREPFDGQDGAALVAALERALTEHFDGFDDLDADTAATPGATEVLERLTG